VHRFLVEYRFCLWAHAFVTGTHREVFSLFCELWCTYFIMSSSLSGKNDSKGEEATCAQEAERKPGRSAGSSRSKSSLRDVSTLKGLNRILLIVLVYVVCV